MTDHRVFQWIPEADLAPKSGDATIYRDYWWVTNADGDLCFYGSVGGRLSPQCNQHETVARKVADYLAIPDAVGVRQVPLVALPSAKRW